MPHVALTDPIEDLVDFYKRWPDLRQAAVELRHDPRLASGQAEMLDWMILVIDRVGPADFDAKDGDTS